MNVKNCKLDSEETDNFLPKGNVDFPQKEKRCEVKSSLT